VNVEVILFVAFAIVAVVGALTMVTARNPVFSAMGLLAAMFAMAVFYVMNDAHFVAAVQVLIYAGAVMTLFLFVIMLIGVDRAEDRTEQIPFQRPVALALGAALVALVFIAARASWVTGFGSGAGEIGTIENISDELFDTWLLPFEATVLLLTIAAVGTIALAQHERKTREVQVRGTGYPVPADEAPAEEAN
jgi:NADH-quinone oxidoreductase subunit J